MVIDKNAKHWAGKLRNFFIIFNQLP